MESNELRIGNLVECFGVREITDINRNKIKVQHESDKGHFICEWCPINSLELKPIPITEEWLIDLGFNKYSYDSFMKRFEKTKGYFEFQIWIVDGETCIKALNYLMPFTYVHELQNIYFALTKQELTLKN